VPVKVLRNSALVWEWGGVGYYPTSGVPFVHVDTGRVRMWPRIPRLELAALFPDGHSKYLPQDGKPITSQDYKVAVAQGLVAQTKLAAAVRLKPAAQEEEVAYADDVVEADETVAQAEPVAPAQPESAAGTPKPILASFTPSMPAAPTLAVESHEQGAPPPPAKLFAYASVGGMSLPSLLPKTHQEAPAPAYRDAEVVGAPEADDDHPDETNYVPFEIAGLMTDSSVAFSRTVAPLTHPDQSNIDYLFDDMDNPTALPLRKNSGYAGLAAAQTFSGHAVKSLYANVAMDTRAPARTQVAEHTR